MKVVSTSTVIIVGLNVIHVALNAAARNDYAAGYVVGLSAAVAVPVAKLGSDLIRHQCKNYTLYAGLFGTGLLWAPVYLAIAYPSLPGWLWELTLVGLGLLVAWAILPFVMSRFGERG